MRLPERCLQYLESLAEERLRIAGTTLDLKAVGQVDVALPDIGMRLPERCLADIEALAVERLRIAGTTLGLKATGQIVVARPDIGMRLAKSLQCHGESVPPEPFEE